MYQILLYNGGVYRFNEIVEHVEDMGGIILKKDKFHISRGSYFISEEIHVIIISPEQAVSEIETISKDVKGQLERLNVEDHEKKTLISILPIYNILSKTGKWTSIDAIEEMIECPCLVEVCKEFESVSCIDDKQKTLENMCLLEIAEQRIKSEKKEYRLKTE